MSQHTPRLVYTSEAGNLFALTPDDGQVRQLTWGWDDHGLSSAAPSTPRNTHVWPAWAPDGSRVAYFGLREIGEEQVETSLYVVTRDGVESWELVSLPGCVPIYGNWSPPGDVFAMLVQHGERRLSLETVSLAHPGTATTLISGAPLFWSWSPRGDLLAVHIGGSQQASNAARVLLLDAHSGQIVREISHRPGDFRVPSWSPHDNLIAYVEAGEDGQNTLFLFDASTGEKGPVTTTRGSSAMVWSADGRFLAFASSAHPSSLVFSLVKVIDLESGQISSLLEKPIIGFFWSPQGDALLSLEVDETRNQLCWHRVSRTSGETTELARFLPSREQTFIFSFFDQYALSHPPIAPDGSALVFAGFLAGADSSSTTAGSHIYVLPLHRPTAPRSVALGHFASWTLKESRAQM